MHCVTGRTDIHSGRIPSHIVPVQVLHSLGYLESKVEYVLWHQFMGIVVVLTVERPDVVSSTALWALDVGHIGFKDSVISSGGRCAYEQREGEVVQQQVHTCTHADAYTHTHTHTTHVCIHVHLHSTHNT